MARNALLVGSVPLSCGQAAMIAASEYLGPYLTRIPDGETGVRTSWLGWQKAQFERSGLFEKSSALDAYGTQALLRFSPSFDVDSTTFPSCGYASEAIASYEIFADLQQAGAISAGTRFQISLPTPTGIIAGIFDPSTHSELEEIIVQALNADIARILSTLPPTSLAIQFDAAIEFALAESKLASPVANEFPVLVDKAARLLSVIPQDVQVGFHLCYGDSGHRHFCEPVDMTQMVNFSNQLVRRSPRSIDWIHMPVPRARVDDEYFRPLRTLDIGSELFLGLIHDDGVEGARRRCDAAKRFAPSFGVATECGLGRRPAGTIIPLLETHRDVCEQL